MSYLIVADVQQWLEQTKLLLTEFDPALELTARNVVLGALSSRYDITTWLDAATTPSQARQIMSMLVAGWTYQRQYSQDLAIDGTNWGVRLEKMAMNLLAAIMDEKVDLMGDTAITAEASSTGPTFYPTDAQEIDDSGEGRKFTMGSVF